MVFKWIKNNVVGDFKAERQNYESRKAQQGKRPVDSAKPTPQGALKTRSYSTRDFDVPIVGESNYQQELRRIEATVKDNAGTGYIKVILAREPENRFDPNAIMVTTTDSQTIGYLSRDLAIQYGAALALWEEEGYRVHCQARLSAGSRGKSMGAWLDLAPPAVISATFGDPNTRK